MGGGRQKFKSERMEYGLIYCGYLEWPGHCDGLDGDLWGTHLALISNPEIKQYISQSIKEIIINQPMDILII